MGKASHNHAHNDISVEPRDLTVHEARRLIVVAALNDGLHRGEDDLRERLKLVPNGWRDWRLVTSTVDRLLTAIYMTIPDEQLISQQHALSHSEVSVKLRSATRLPEWVHIKADDMDMLIGLAIQSECRICLRTDSEVRRCKLRKVLQCVIPPAVQPRHGCGYRDIAGEYDWTGKGEFNAP